MHKTKGNKHRARTPLMSASAGVLLLVYPYFGRQGWQLGPLVDTIIKNSIFRINTE